MIHDAESVVSASGEMLSMYSTQSVPSGTCKATQSVFVVFHSAVPVRAEAENVFVEMVFGSTVIDNEAGVNELIRVEASVQIQREALP